MLTISRKLFFGLGLVLILLIVTSSFVFAQKGVGKGGVPGTVEELKSQIADLQGQIDTIELIKGDKGDPGVNGTNGTNGTDGLPGADSTVAGPIGPQGPAGVIEPGRYEGLDADTVDGLHASQIIEAATSGGGGGSGTFQFVGITSVKTDGGAQIGGLSKMCNNDYPGSRMCTTKEIMESINPFPEPLPEAAWVRPSPLGAYDWMVPFGTNSGIQSNCSAWTQSDWYRGGMTVAEQGRMSSGACEVSRPVACCAVK